MRLYHFSLVIIAVIILFIQLEPTYYVINYVTIPASVLCLFGLIYQYTQKNIFGYIAMAGFAVFLPIGALGILSIREAMDKKMKLEFIRKLNND
ncbi:hypothetical protein [Pseudoalteromonas porphyrae]|uniref:Uncharacterized protein n=1 Tax=Pseudoalteromonas porphyrae TaxID=187330 RepID=A0A0N0LUD1_9GAMM|nr:hypothetical protein [Pseudoalteromonas porphyrae]KPH56968.1 hypothetical protein ADS77_19585 [Pseudoalteromonas porphyrae]